MDEKLLKGRYEVLAEIGRGQRTVAYKARDTSLDRIVVLKILRDAYAREPQWVDRFHSAARAMAGVSHPNVVDVYDVGTDAGTHYVVTEYVEGQSLESLLASRGTLTLQEALQTAVHVCAALGAAHRAGLVHGQLTPRNILLVEGQGAKVSDFGVVDTPAPVVPGEDDSAAVGSALYLSPEQAMGRRTVPASDVYALGVILYQMLAGRPPFEGEDPSVVKEKHIRQLPEALHLVNPSVPQPLSQLVHRALAKRSTERYRTATDFGAALTGYRRRAEESEVAARVRAEERELALEQRRREWSEAQRRQRTEEMVVGAAATAARGPDWTLITLSMLAVVAVLGLVPLWLVVVLRYFA
jgi:serine/threonine protein kinase